MSKTGFRARPAVLSPVPFFGAVFCVGLSAVVAHPGFWPGQTPALAIAVPAFVAMITAFLVLRPMRRKSIEVLQAFEAERDGAVARANRLSEDLEVAELALAQSDAGRRRAEGAAAAKARYLSVISQEVRTPLTGVIGMSDLLAETQLDDEQEALVETVRQSSEDLQAVLSAVVDFAALETNELQLEDAPFDLLEAAERVLRDERGAARKKGIELVLDAWPGVLTKARGDGRRFQQLLSLLVSNAVKFTDRGHVVLRLGTGDQTLGTDAVIVVEDTGIGIRAEDHARIFHPFVQGGSPDGRRYGGPGLGLSLADRLASLMAGRIEVASTEGEGSRFTLRIAQRLRQTARGSAPAGPDLGGSRFLIVDDCAPAAGVLARQLRYWGADVEVVATVEEGEDGLWEGLATGPDFTAVFIDISLPGIDGIALASRIAEKVQHLPLILMSPSDLRAAKAAVREGVGVASLEKPMRVDDLKAALETVKRAGKELKVTEARTEGPTSTVTRPIGPVLQPACIVLADDNATNRILIEKFLADEPMTLIHASDGMGAIEAFSSWAPDLILMDVAMPRMDGLEATRRIRSAERAQGAARVPIIALTARAEASDREHCLEAGMDDYVTKPIRKSELKAKLTEWVHPARKRA